MSTLPKVVDGGGLDICKIIICGLEATANSMLFIVLYNQSHQLRLCRMSKYPYVYTFVTSWLAT
jgi:hypothetical protein